MEVLKRFVNNVKYKLADKQWNIAICDLGKDLQPANVRWLKHDYTDRWFADPFIIAEDDSTFTVLVEELMYDVAKGRIARLTIDRKSCLLLKNELLLELPTHLSFPNFLEFAGKTYLYPENSRSGSLSYYNYNEGMRVEGSMIDKPLTDAAFVNISGDNLLFSTHSSNCNGKVCEIFSAPGPFGPYAKKQEVCFSDNIARNAGRIFEFDGRLIRPAQICNKDYGEGISLQEISYINGKVELREFKRMLPPSKEYADGFHTFNVFGSHVVIDGYRYRSRTFKALFEFLIRCVLRIYHWFR